MENQLTIVDFGVLGILLVSGLIAAYRGFLKETLSVSAWLLAAARRRILLAGDETVCPHRWSNRNCSPTSWRSSACSSCC